MTPPWPPIYQPHIDRAQAALVALPPSQEGKGRRPPHHDTLHPRTAAVILVILAVDGRRTARTVCDALGFGGKNLDLDLTLARAIAANELGVREALPGLTLPARRMEHEEA